MWWWWWYFRDLLKHDWFQKGCCNNSEETTRYSCLHDVDNSKFQHVEKLETRQSNLVITCFFSFFGKGDVFSFLEVVWKFQTQSLKAEMSYFWEKIFGHVIILTCWDGLRYMVSITLNSALFSKISNVHIFRTMHRIVMIFSSKCRLQITWQILSAFGTVEYSTGPMRTHKEPTNWASNLAPKLPGWKRQKLLVRQKIEFFQSPRYRYTNRTTEKETSNKC